MKLTEESKNSSSLFVNCRVFSSSHFLLQLLLLVHMLFSLFVEEIEEEKSNGKITIFFGFIWFAKMLNYYKSLLIRTEERGDFQIKIKIVWTSKCLITNFSHILSSVFKFTNDKTKHQAFIIHVI